MLILLAHPCAKMNFGALVLQETGSSKTAGALVLNRIVSLRRWCSGIRIVVNKLW
jgi:hypothetical protein